MVGLWGLILAESVIFNDMSGAIVLSKGYPKLLFIANMIQAVCMVPALYISAQYGFQALVVVSCIVGSSFRLLRQSWQKNVSGIKATEVIHQIRYYILASAGMAIAALFMIQIAGSGILKYFSIFICIGIYFGILFFIPSTRKELNTYLITIEEKDQKIKGVLF